MCICVSTNLNVNRKILYVCTKKLASSLKNDGHNAKIRLTQYCTSSKQYLLSENAECS